MVTEGAIRAILFRYWDPICVSPNEKLSDEYDELVPQLMKLIGLDVPSIAIEEALSAFEERVDSRTSPQRRQRASALLLALREPH